MNTAWFEDLALLWLEAMVKSIQRMYIQPAPPQMPTPKKRRWRRTGRGGYVRVRA